MAASNSESDTLLRLSGISKRFPGVQALDEVDFDIRPGEVVGLVGENGSGKSTLLKVIAGSHAPDAGGIEFEGRSVTLTSPAAALDLGIALIAQEVLVQPRLTVAENLLDRRAPRRFGLLDWRRLFRTAAEELDALDLPMDRERRSEIFLCTNSRCSRSRGLYVGARDWCSSTSRPVP